MRKSFQKAASPPDTAFSLFQGESQLRSEAPENGQQVAERTVPPRGFFRRETPPSVGQHGTFPYRELKDSPPRQQEPLTGGEETGNGGDFRYFGQTLGVFLLVEHQEKVFLIDQHAAHERILFEVLKKGAGKKQLLLVPHEFEVSEEEDALIRKHLEKLESLGIHMEKSSEESWSITAVPEVYKSLLSDVAAFLQGGLGSVDDLDKNFIATMACRAAVKDGDQVDPLTAREIIRGAFELEVPRCPHGRPVWVEISREQLFSMVGRTP